MYPKRIRLLTALLPPCNTFVDVGCDHGYCAEYMLKNGLCKRAIITDISAPSLQKAEKLLKNYVDKGVCQAVCTDGLYGVDNTADLVLIAGMGGMEICHILGENGGFIPQKFVLQPMRDGDKVRRLLLANGATITRDFTFTDGRKYYSVILGEGAPVAVEKADRTAEYTQTEILFGRDNICERGEAFLRYLQEEIDKSKRVLCRPIDEPTRLRTEQKIRYLQGVLDGEIK